MALTKLTKILYCICHFALCITDITVIVLTLYILTLFVQYRLFLPVILYWPGILLIFFNFAQFFGFWQGVTGIIKENRNAIIILCTTLVMNSVIDLIIGVWVLNINNGIHQDINNKMDNLYGNYTKLQIKKEEWNNLQFQLKCCGIDGPQSFSKMGADFLPISCCNTTKNAKTCENGLFYKNGCLESLTYFVQEQQGQLIFLIMIFVIIQIIGIGIFCNLNAVMSKKENLEPTTLKNETLPLKGMRTSLNA